VECQIRRLRGGLAQNAEGRRRDVGGRRAARTNTISDGIADKDARWRIALATTMPAPMQSTIVTMTASSAASCSVPSQCPVASRTCTPMQSVKSTAVNNLPRVRRKMRHHTMRISASLRD
jgi:hypothetical protein